MQKILLVVLHEQQRDDADCLAACALMCLRYLGKDVTYERVKQLLQTRWFGTPANNVTKLSQLGVRVELKELSASDVHKKLQMGLPVIAFVSTSDLPYWVTDTNHAIVVVGMDDGVVYVNDPAFNDAPQAISRVSFDLATLKFDGKCAVLSVR